MHPQSDDTDVAFVAFETFVVVVASPVLILVFPVLFVAELFPVFAVVFVLLVTCELFACCVVVCCVVETLTVALVLAPFPETLISSDAIAWGAITMPTNISKQDEMIVTFFEYI